MRGWLELPGQHLQTAKTGSEFEIPILFARRSCAVLLRGEEMVRKVSRRFLSLAVLSGFLTVADSPISASEGTADLIAGLKPLASAIAGRESRFQISGEVSVPIDGSQQSITVNLTRYDEHSFDLELAHSDYAVSILRRADQTILLLPKHQTAFIARGDVDSADSMQPAGIVSRLVSGSSSLNEFAFGLNLLAAGDLDATLAGLLAAAKLEHDPAAGTWKSGDTTLTVPRPGTAVTRTGVAAGSDSSATSGNQIVKAVPLPRTLSTVIAPPDCCTIP